MGIERKKIAITGAGRGLGAALAISVADAGAVPILLGRSRPALEKVAAAILHRTGQQPDVLACDLTDFASIADAAGRIAEAHPDLDVLVNNASRWTGGAFEAQDDEAIAEVAGSTVTGMMALTRRLLPLLKARPWADIHTVVSMSGLQYARFLGSSLPFRAAKAAQDGFVQGLVEELRGANVRVTSIYPGLIEDVSPLDARWNEARTVDDGLTDRDVVEAIVYALSAPPNVALRQIVIERAKTDFLA